MKYTVRLSHAAQRDIDELLDYLVPRAGEAVARGYIGRVKAFLGGFEAFPKRGTVRSDTREGLRVIGFERSLSIAFTVKEDTVYILRVLTKGQEVHLYDE